MIDVLALAEPLEPEVLHGLCGADAVTRVVDRGLVEIVADGEASRARLGHPLVGEVQRSRCGLLRARRLRGEIAAALAAAGACGADDVLRRAVLVLDSDLPGDPELFTVAARRAAGVTDLVLADRLARAAIAAGGGFEARLTLACAVVGLSGDSDTELAEAIAHAGSDAELAIATVMRATQLYWMAARPDAADAVVVAAQEAVADPDAARELAAFRLVTEACLGRTGYVVAAAPAVLAAPALSDAGVLYASCGLVVALGAQGRAEELAGVAARAEAAAARSLDLEWITGPVTAWYVLGLRLAGRVADLAAVVERFRERCSDGPFDEVVTAVVTGYGELGRGRRPPDDGHHHLADRPPHPGRAHRADDPRGRRGDGPRGGGGRRAARLRHRRRREGPRARRRGLRALRDPAVLPRDARPRGRHRSRRRRADR